jgi:hypothetical protein
VARALYREGVALLAALLLITVAAIATCGIALWLDTTENVRRLRREYRRSCRAEQHRHG